jgi:hypothetical protein
VTLVAPANCTVTGPNNVPITVADGATADLGVTVTCRAPVGAVRLIVATTGADADTAYWPYIDGVAAMTAIASNASTLLSNVEVGPHVIELTDVAANCAVNGPNPATVTVTAGVTTDLHFAVTCLGNGTVHMTVSTTGADIPATYGAGAAGSYVALPANGTGSLTLPPGSQVVRLFVPANCNVTSNDVPVTVISGATVDVAFKVGCVADGVLRVTVTTTGAGFGGFRLYSDFSESYRTVSENGTSTLRMTPGIHHVYLIVLQGNCHVSSPSSVTVTIVSGDTADVAFHVSCVANGTLRVSVSTIGPNAPARYQVLLSPDLIGAAVPANGATSISLKPGVHSVSLSVPQNCTGDPENVQAPIASGATLDIAFVVTCQ